MKKYTKMVSILLIMMVIMSIATSAYATFDPSDVNSTIEGTNGIQKIGGSIVGFVQVGGTITAVVILIVIGIRYMLASAQEKAEYKKVMIPYIVGAVLIFAASNIAGMIYTWADNLPDDTGSTSVVATIEK